MLHQIDEHALQEVLQGNQELIDQLGDFASKLTGTLDNNLDFCLGGVIPVNRLPNDPQNSQTIFLSGSGHFLNHVSLVYHSYDESNDIVYFAFKHFDRQKARLGKNTVSLDNTHRIDILVGFNQESRELSVTKLDNPLTLKRVGILDEGPQQSPGLEAQSESNSIIANIATDIRRKRENIYREARLANQNNDQFDTVFQYKSNSDVSRKAEHYYFYSDFIENQGCFKTFCEHHKLSQPLTLYEWRLIQKLILAVKELHEQDIFHNDLHGNNILITLDHEIAIIDYGCAIEGYDVGPKIASVDGYCYPSALSGEQSDIYVPGDSGYNVYYKKHDYYYIAINLCNLLGIKVQPNIGSENFSNEIILEKLSNKLAEIYPVEDAKESSLLFEIVEHFMSADVVEFDGLTDKINTLFETISEKRFKHDITKQLESVDFHKSHPLFFHFLMGISPDEENKVWYSLYTCYEDSQFDLKQFIQSSYEILLANNYFHRAPDVQALWYLVGKGVDQYAPESFQQYQKYLVQKNQFSLQLGEQLKPLQFFQICCGMMLAKGYRQMSIITDEGNVASPAEHLPYAAIFEKDGQKFVIAYPGRDTQHCPTNYDRSLEDIHQQVRQSLAEQSVDNSTRIFCPVLEKHGGRKHYVLGVLSRDNDNGYLIIEDSFSKTPVFSYDLTPAKQKIQSSYQGFIDININDIVTCGERYLSKQKDSWSCGHWAIASLATYLGKHDKDDKDELPNSIDLPRLEQYEYYARLYALHNPPCGGIPFVEEDVLNIESEEFNGFVMTGNNPQSQKYQNKSHEVELLNKTDDSIAEDCFIIKHMATKSPVNAYLNCYADNLRHELGYEFAESSESLRNLVTVFTHEQSAHVIISNELFMRDVAKPENEDSALASLLSEVNFDEPFRLLIPITDQRTLPPKTSYMVVDYQQRENQNNTLTIYQLGHANDDITQIVKDKLAENAENLDIATHFIEPRQGETAEHALVNAVHWAFTGCPVAYDPQVVTDNHQNQKYQIFDTDILGENQHIAQYWKEQLEALDSQTAGTALMNLYAFEQGNSEGLDLDEGLKNLFVAYGELHKEYHKQVSEEATPAELKWALQEKLLGLIEHSDLDFKQSCVLFDAAVLAFEGKLNHHKHPLFDQIFGIKVTKGWGETKLKAKEILVRKLFNENATYLSNEFVEQLMDSGVVQGQNDVEQNVNLQPFKDAIRYLQTSKAMGRHQSGFFQPAESTVNKDCDRAAKATNEVNMINYLIHAGHVLRP